MINKKLHIVLIILIIWNVSNLLSQTSLDNTGGSINNSGTIRVKNGQTKALPDTIGGRMEFLQKNTSSQQVIPNIVYNQLMIGNTALKLISDEKKDAGVVRKMVIRDSLIIADTADFSSRWIGLFSEEVNAKSTVKNTAKYSSGKDLVLIGTVNAQDLLGDGSFSRLRIENPFGVDVRGGGFRVEERLSLKIGELRNSQTENFTMADSSMIVRTAGAKISYEPVFEGVVTVKYDGIGDMTAGGEIPTNAATLKSFYIENQGIVTLSKNTTVHDSLIIRAMVKTLDDTLELATLNNPYFDRTNDSLEIVGNFKRSVLAVGDTLYLNNPYTWLLFETTEGMANLSAITSTILPHTFHQLLEADTKVRRVINLSGYDSFGNEVSTDFNAKFGYGWRNAAKTAYDETNNLVPIELVLQRWIGDRWQSIISDVPTLDTSRNWGYAKADIINRFGSFALGPNKENILFRAFALFEGPYITGTGNRMTMELWQRNLIRQADITQYPLNLFARTPLVLPSVLPDSIVDYVLLEFRKLRNEASSFQKLAFIKYNGRIVDLFGNERINLSIADGIDSLGGKYYVVIRHRNHAPVITNDQIELKEDSNAHVYNFSDPSFVEGGASVLRLVDKIDDKYIYAVKGGFIAYNNPSFTQLMNVTINYTDPAFWSEAWKQFTNIGYINVDYNLSGIVTTKDFNISWNNRSN
jgi:hypothetical protein